MRELWAVARLGFIEGSRSRLTALFIGLLVLTIIIIASVSESPSLSDQMRMFLSYGVGSTSVLLSILTILLTCAVLCREVERRYVFTSLTKPIARWKHIVGRWLGVCGLQAVLVVCCGLAMYGAAHYMRYSAGAVDPGHPLNSEVMCSRVSHGPIDMSWRIRELMRERVARLKKSSEYDSRIAVVGQEAMDRSVYQYAIDQLESTGPGGELTWRFDGLPKPADTGQTVQFRIELEAGNAMPLEELQREVHFINPKTHDEIRMAVRYPVGSPKAVQLPAQLISEEGALEVKFLNRPPLGAPSPIESSVTISMNDVRLLYRVGGFAANFARAMLLVWLLQAFLAAVAVLIASWLSFAVACLWCVVLYILGLAAPFVIESTTVGPSGGAVSTIGRYLSRGILALLPDFALVSPGDALIGGLLISWPHIAATVGLFLGVWCTIPLMLAAAVFTRRELARVIAE